jgi:hypothetical protein
VIFTAVFDGSGHETDVHGIAVAGFLSSDRVWAAFDEAWRKRLQDDNLAHFRMSEFAHWTGQFADRSYWVEQRRRRLLGDLVGLVQPNSFRKFGCVVVNASFATMSEAQRDEFLMTAYVLAARTCAGSVAQWAMDEKIRKPIAYVFEEGDLDPGKLTERMIADGFPAPIFLPKKDEEKNGSPYPAYTPLQAADILAYETLLASRRNAATRWAFREFDTYPPGPLGRYEPDNIKRLDEDMAAYNLAWHTPLIPSDQS